MENLRNMPDEPIPFSQQDSSFHLLFEDISSASRKLSPSQVWTQEIGVYQNMNRADGKSDPLIWWRCNAYQLPNLCMKSFSFHNSIISQIIGELARKYLGIPASQASCERIFSISKNDITETRTSIKPELAEALLIVRKKKDIFVHSNGEL